MIHVYIPGEAVPMARPRVVHFGKRVRTFNPLKMRNYERYARVEGLGQYKGLPIKNKPVGVSIIVHKKIPQSWSEPRKSRADHLLVKTRPDLDNYVKSLVDSFIGVLYEDDNLMAKLDAVEIYDRKPGVDFRVRSLPERLDA